MKNEWLETDGLGGFASGTAAGLRTRRYHGWLIAATTPPTGRMVLVNGADVLVETPGGAVGALDTGLRPRRGRRRGGAVHRELLAPSLAGRDFHALMHENPQFSFDPEIGVTPAGAFLRYRPYPGSSTIAVSSSGVYRHQPLWYRHFAYGEERSRGLDSGRRSVSGHPSRRSHDHRRLSLVRRLGARYFHLGARVVPGHRPGGRGPRGSLRLGGAGLGGHAAQLFSGRERSPGIQHRRWVAVVRGGGR